MLGWQRLCNDIHVNLDGLSIMKKQTPDFYAVVRNIILESRLRVFRVANTALLETYWHIGRTIIEEEQDRKAKADYGKNTLKLLAEKLTLEFGKGFDESNLRNMRSFFRAFPIRDALRTELSLTHYRQLSRLDTAAKRAYYLSEAVAGNWNSRELQRQINTLAFERVLEHKPQSEELLSIQNLLKDPYIFEFLGLPPMGRGRQVDTKNSERDLETAIIDHL